MLAAGGHAFPLQRFHDRRAEPSDFLGFLRKRAIANHEIPRIRENVQHRRVVERDADGLQLRRERAGESLGQAHVAAPAQGRHRGPLGEGRLETCDTAAFLIDADPKRQLRDQSSRVVAQLGDLFRLPCIACEENDAA